VPRHDYGHPVWVAAYHSSPLAVITPADEESPRVQLACDPLKLIGRLDFQYEASQTGMACSPNPTRPKRAEHDDLRVIALWSGHRRQLLLLGQQRKTKHLTIELNRSVEICHVHHYTLKVHPLLQVFTRAEEAPVHPSFTFVLTNTTYPFAPARTCTSLDVDPSGQRRQTQIQL
jgi:hypothetical protein